MNKSGFFAMISRMKHINRWSLMRNTCKENLSEHSLDAAVIAHALCIIKNKRFGGGLNPERAAILAVFHDVPEILTGDLPTPVKYFNADIRKAYKIVEKSAGERLLSMLPEDFDDDYRPLLIPENDEYTKIIKAADKICALIKCIEERKAGNHEFETAEKLTRQAVLDLNLPEAEYFLNVFLPAYYLNIDELENNNG